MTLVKKISMKETGYFSGLFIDYLTECCNLKGFYAVHPAIENLDYYFDKFDNINRNGLVKELKNQHASLQLSKEQNSNIEDLEDNNTFTVTTGHQLNIFCGPMFFIYKIISTIKSCEQLKEKYPNKNFVPIYWMASEDHDFAEINHFRLFNKVHSWETEQTGAVGRMTTNGIQSILDELEDLPELFKVYSEGLTLTEATRKIVHELFKQYGLLVLDADSKPLKAEFSPIIKKELTKQSSIKAIQEQTSKLDKLGYKGQVHPREINLFYMNDDIRARIEQQGNKYIALGTNLSWSQEEILKLAETNPEQFSPNVALRPVYQQMILPNIAYIGGPGELAYWLQLSKIFDDNNVVFPSLMPRNFGLYINKGINKKIKKFDLDYTQLFNQAHELKTDFIKQQGAEFELSHEAKQIDLVLGTLSEKVDDIDKSLKATVESEAKKIEKQLLNIEKKVKKAQESKYTNELTQLMNIKEKLFPNGGLQERQENFLNFYINDKDFINKIYHAFEPFDYQFHVIIDE